MNKYQCVMVNISERNAACEYLGSIRRVWLAQHRCGAFARQSIAARRAQKRASGAARGSWTRRVDMLNIDLARRSISRHQSRQATARLWSRDRRK